MPENTVITLARGTHWVDKNWQFITDCKVSRRLKPGDQLVITDHRGRTVHLGTAMRVRPDEVREKKEKGVYVQTDKTANVPRNDGFLHLRL